MRGILSLGATSARRRVMQAPLAGKIALVAGATRGAGRGIASMLGEAGATVYCTGRSTRGTANPKRPETIEESAERVSALGGVGIAVRVDHQRPEEVAALCARIEQEQGGLDILVNDIWGGESLTDINSPFWTRDPAKALTLWERAVFTHIVTSRFAVPLLLRRGRGLIVEVTDGDHFGYRGGLVYDQIKMSVIRLAFAMAWELRRTKVTALAITPGFLRSEEMLDLFGVTESNWREGVSQEPHFIASETPDFVGRAVAALAADERVHEKAGRVFSSWGLSREYGFLDRDGSRPDWGAYFEKTFGKPCPRADEAAYTAWREGPLEIAYPHWPEYDPATFRASAPEGGPSGSDSGR
jgi:NAD(P)-dependent dehydrogenase (short-subunit alcohol dehydrogenase family)